MGGGSERGEGGSIELTIRCLHTQHTHNILYACMNIHTRHGNDVVTDKNEACTFTFHS